MPTVLRVGPYRFFFYAGDGGEPPHVHVMRDTSEAKFWLEPVSLERNHGFKKKAINYLLRQVTLHAEELLEKWHEFFQE